jgi:hypothetical protein
MAMHGGHLLRGLVQSLDDGGVPLTHRLQRVASAALFQNGDHRRQDASTAGAQRMSDGDRAAVDIRLGQIGRGVLGQASVGSRATSWHRLGPCDMSFEAKGFRHIAVAVTELQICRDIAVGARQ